MRTENEIVVAVLENEGYTCRNKLSDRDCYLFNCALQSPTLNKGDLTIPGIMRLRVEEKTPSGLWNELYKTESKSYLHKFDEYIALVALQRIINEEQLIATYRFTTYRVVVTFKPL